MPEAPRPDDNKLDIHEPDDTRSLKTSPPEDPADAEARRSHGFFRRFVIRSLMWGMAVLAAVIFLGGYLLNTPRTREWARQQIEVRASAALKRQVTLDAVYFELVPLSVTVEGLRISGGPDFPNNPFLVLPRAEVEADLEILTRRRLRLRMVKLERPQIDLRFTAVGDNLIGGGEPTGEKAELNIVLDRVEIDRGWVRLDEEPLELSFVAEDISSRLVGLGKNHLQGEIAIPRIELALPKAKPVDMALEGKLEATLEGLQIEQATITGQGVQIETRGACDWSGKGGQGNKCDLETRGHADGDLLARLGYFDELRGDLRFDGRFSWRGAVGWRGKVMSDSLGIFDFDLEDLEGQLSADRFGIRLGLNGARYSGGNLHGTVEADLSVPDDPLTIALDADGVALDPLFADIKIPVKGLASTAHGRMTFKAPMRKALTGSGAGEFEIRPAAGRGIPFAGTVPLQIENGVLRLGAVSLRAPQQGVLASGSYDLATNRGRITFDVATSDPAQVIDLVMADRLDPAAERPIWAPISGVGRAAVDLTLEPGSFRADLDLDLEQVRTAQIATAVDVDGSLELTSDAVENLRLDISHGNSALTLAGRAPYDSTVRPIDLKADIFSWPLSEAKALLPFELPLDGPVSGRLGIQIRNDKTSGSLDGHLAPALVTLQEEPLRLDHLEAHLDWDDRQVRFREVEARTPAGTVRAAGTFGIADQQLALKVRGSNLDVAAAPLAGYLPVAGAAGRLTLEASLAGTLERPRVELDAELFQAALGERELPGRSRLTGSWDGQRMEVEGVLLDAISLRGGGTLAIDQQVADLGFDVAAADLGEIARLFAFDPGYPLGGELAARVAVQGQLSAPEVGIELGKSRLVFDNHTLVGRPGARVRLAGGAWQVADVAFEEEGTQTFLRLDGQADPAQGGLGIRVRSKVDAEWLQLAIDAFAPDLGLKPRGQLAIEGTLAGPFGAPTFEGRVDILGIDMAVPGIDEGLRDLRGTALFTPGHIDLGRLEGRIAGGVIAISGQADLPRAAGENLPARPFSYGLQISGRDLRLRSIDGWSVAGNADLTLRSIERGHFLGGRANIEEFDFRREIKLDVATLLRDFLRKQRLEVQPAGSALANFQLNVEVRADHSIRVVNNLADLRASANFNLRGTLAAPLVYGEMSVDPGGKLVYNDSDYLIERGRLIFADPLKIDPEIDLVANTRVREFDINLAIFGTLNRLETRFASQPPLPDVDVFRLLAEGDFGSGDSPLNNTQRGGESTPSLSAASFLYGQAASAIGERVSNLFGLDKFRVDPLVGGSGDTLSAARVTVGKRLSRRLSLTYSVDPSTTESQRLQVEWRLTDGVVLVLTQNGDSTYSADARWDISF